MLENHLPCPGAHTLPCPYLWPSTMGCSSCSRVCLLPQQLLALIVYSCPGQSSQVACLPTRKPVHSSQVGEAIPTVAVRARLPEAPLQTSGPPSFAQQTPYLQGEGLGQVHTDAGLGTAAPASQAPHDSQSYCPQPQRGRGLWGERD